MSSDILELQLRGLSATDVPLRMKRIAPGSFRMGQRGQNADEEPVHTVVIPAAFYIGVWPVTQTQYRLMAEQCLPELQALEGNRGVRPSQLPNDGAGGDHPVDSVSWDDANILCAWLNRSGLIPEGWSAALPTEACWEYACRAGSVTQYSFGDQERRLADFGWYADNAGATTHRVGLKQPNAWGLFDMHGNVWEWCQDLYDPRIYRRRPDGGAASVVLDPATIDRESPPGWLQPLVQMLQRFSDPAADLQVHESEREALDVYFRHAQDRANGDPQWKEDVRAARTARLHGAWDARYCSLAAGTLPVFADYLAGFSGSARRVLRGGGWDFSAWNCRSAYRDGWGPGIRNGGRGFRVCLFSGPVPQQSVSTAAESECGSAAGALRLGRAEAEDRHEDAAAVDLSAAHIGGH